MSLIRNLIRNYGEFQIDIPEWEISDEGITALVGPSGSGKTSVIRLLLGLDSCVGLEWQFFNLNLAKMPIEHRRLGVVFQNYDLFLHMTARQNIAFAIHARQLIGEHVERRLQEIIEHLKMKSYLDRPVRVLSGGERQRVAIARALIGEPRFLFLDEPFTALDANLRTEARALLKQLIARYKIPTLLVSHDDGDIQDLAAQVVYIKNGKLV